MVRKSSSATATWAMKEVSFTTVMIWLSMVGTMRRKHWGRMIYHRVPAMVKPWEWAASNWPLGMALSPPRTISAIMAEVNST